MQVTPRVVDLSHYQYDELGGKFDWAKVKQAGIWGVIYKATEGVTYQDDTFKDARKQVEAAGLLFGAYHFFRPGNIQGQVDNFLNWAQPDGDMLLVLDHEDEGCSVSDVKEWLKAVEDATGQRPALYSGHVIKQQLGNTKDDYLSTVRLWLCQYGSDPEWPPCWNSMWLWQYTDGQSGPSPHSVAGIGNCDINSYGLSQDQLEKSWAPGAHIDIDVNFGMSETDMLWVQASLNLLKDAGLVTDGLYGPATQGALEQFQKDHRLPQSGKPTKETVDQMVQDLDKWNRDRDFVDVNT